MSRAEAGDSKVVAVVASEDAPALSSVLSDVFSKEMTKVEALREHMSKEMSKVKAVETNIKAAVDAKVEALSQEMKEIKNLLIAMSKAD